MKSNVAIILGFWNGEQFLKQQLDSLAFQTHKDFHVFIFDDASTRDEIPNVVKISELSPKKITIVRRRFNLGFAKNFLDGLSKINGNFELFAFCDQDDIWNPKKLERAVQCFLPEHISVPTLYCSRTTAVDQFAERTIGSSPLFKKPPGFKNALLQNICSGNTVVINAAARRLICKATAKVNLIAHDWWCYIMITGAGGNIIFDEYQSIKYRQHSDNVIGLNNNLGAKFKRFQALWQGQFGRWNDIHEAAIEQNSDLLTLENKRVFKQFKQMRRAPVIERLQIMHDAQFYRQTKLTTIMWIVALIFRKI